MKEITLLVKIRGLFFLRGALGGCLSCLYARAGCVCGWFCLSDMDFWVVGGCFLNLWWWFWWLFFEWWWFWWLLGVRVGGWRWPMGWDYKVCFCNGWWWLGMWWLIYTCKRFTVKYFTSKRSVRIISLKTYWAPGNGLLLLLWRKINHIQKKKEMEVPLYSKPGQCVCTVFHICAAIVSSIFQSTSQNLKTLSTNFWSLRSDMG